MLAVGFEWYVCGGVHIPPFGNYMRNLDIKELGTISGRAKHNT